VICRQGSHITGFKRWADQAGGFANHFAEALRLAVVQMIDSPSVNGSATVNLARCVVARLNAAGAKCLLR